MNEIEMILFLVLILANFLGWFGTIYFGIKYKGELL